MSWAKCNPENVACIKTVFWRAPSLRQRFHVAQGLLVVVLSFRDCRSYRAESRILLTRRVYDHLKTQCCSVLLYLTSLLSCSVSVSLSLSLSLSFSFFLLFALAFVLFGALCFSQHTVCSKKRYDVETRATICGGSLLIYATAIYSWSAVLLSTVRPHFRACSSDPRK